MGKEWDAIASRNAFYGVLSWAEFEAVEQVDREKFWATGRREVDLFLSRLNLGDTASWSMVEIGCGLGRMTHRFAERFARVYSVDVSAEMLSRARDQWSSLENVKFTLGRGNDLPGIFDASIDFVFSFIVLQHVPNPEIVKDYIRETGRVLKPGGLAHLQFRTEADCSLLHQISLVGFRAYRALTHPRRAFSTGIGRLQSYLAGLWAGEPEHPIKWVLAHDFERFECWRGCALQAGQVEALATSVELSIEKVEGVGTQYTFYTFRKRSGGHGECVT